MPEKTKTSITLGKNDISLRYDAAAILLLDERGINLYDQSTYVSFSPNKLCDLVWIGQLHRKNDALSRQQVIKLLPTNTDDYYEIAEAIANAIRAAIASPKPE